MLPTSRSRQSTGHIIIYGQTWAKHRKIIFLNSTQVLYRTTIQSPVLSPGLPFLCVISFATLWEDSVEDILKYFS